MTHNVAAIAEIEKKKKEWMDSALIPFQVGSRLDRGWSSRRAVAPQARTSITVGFHVYTHHLGVLVCWFGVLVWCVGVAH